MGNTIIKITKAGAARQFGTTDARESIEYAFGASDERISERVVLATLWRDAGYSIRGAVAGVTVAFNGNAPDGFTKSSVGRAYIVADIVNPSDPDADRPLAHLEDDGAFAEVVAGLVSVAKHGKGATETALTAYLAAATHGKGIDAIAKAARDSKAVQAALTGATTRPVAGEAADGGKVDGGKVDTDTDDAPTTTAPVGTNGTPGLMSVGTARLFTELSRRIEHGEFTEDDWDALDAFAAFSEEWRVVADTAALDAMQ